jgi:hypothetical protein
MGKWIECYTGASGKDPQGAVERVDPEDEKVGPISGLMQVANVYDSIGHADLAEETREKLFQLAIGGGRPRAPSDFTAMVRLADHFEKNGDSSKALKLRAKLDGGG